MNKVCNNDENCSADGDFHRTCRVCMTASNINLKYLFDRKNLDIVKKIEFCTGILFKKENGFPSQICSLCVRSLSMAHKFKSKCLKSDETFRKLKKIKVEVTASNNDDDYNFNDNGYFDDSKCFDSKINDVENTNEIKHEDTVKEVVVKVEEIEQIENCLKRKEEQSNLDNIKISITKLKGNGIQWTPQPKYRRLFCVKCNMKFQNREESAKHRKEFHKRVRVTSRRSDGTKPWVCEICGRCYAHRTSLDTHVTSHFSPQNECDYCGYRTCYKFDLIKHIRIHTGDKKYKCDQCTCAFYNSSNLLNHKRRIHEQDRRFSCPRPNCGKAFCDKSQLERHLDSHDSVKRFKCDICHSVLSRRNHWKKHMLRQHKILIPRAKSGRKRQNVLVEESDDDRRGTANRY